MTNKKLLYNFGLVLLIVSQVLTPIPLFSSASHVQKAKADITSDLIHHWEFNESSINGTPGEVNDSVGSRNGYAVNGASVTTGKIGNAASFDGSDDYINVDTSAFVVPEAFTIAVWVYRDTSGSRHTIFSGCNDPNSDCTGLDYDALLFEIDGSNKVALSMNWRRSSTGSCSYASSPAITTGVWTHVAVTFDRLSNNTNVKMYINGSEVARSRSCTGSSTANIPINTGIGAQVAGNNTISFSKFEFDGAIDDLRFYDRLLDSADVEELYGTSFGPDTDESLEGHWKMDESSWNGTSDEVIDSSLNSNHGRSIGGANTAIGKYLNGGDFDGVNDYVDITGSSSLNITGNITMSAWVYFNGEGIGNHIVMSKKYSSKLQYAFGRYYSGNPKGTHHFFAGLNTGDTWTDYTSGYTLNNDTWYHLTVSYNQSSVKFYVDGVEVADVAASGTITGDSVGRFTIGADANLPTWNEYTNAIIDDVRVYSRYLLPNEVDRLYNSGIVQASCPASVQARFQVGSTGLHEAGTFAVSTLNSGGQFQWSVVMNGDVYQVFGGEVTLTKPDLSTESLAYANGEPVGTTQTGNYSIVAKAENGSVCATASITVVPDPANGLIIPGNNSGVETVIGGTDISTVPSTGIEDVYVRDNNSNIVARLTVDKDSGRDWGAMTAFSRDKAEFGKGNAAILHYPGGASNIPGIVGSSFTLYVPRSEGDTRVRLCPGLQVSDQLDQECEGGLTLALGTTGQYTVSAVTLETKDYWEIDGVTGTGGITITDGVKDTLTRIQISEASDHTIQFGTTNGLTSSGNTITITFDSAGQNWDLSSIVLTDIDLEDDGVDKTLAATPGADIWGLVINTSADTLTFTAPTSGTDYVAAGSVLVVKVGVVADGGSNQIINPGSVNTYEIDVANNTGAITETGETEIPIIDDDTVNVSGYIDSFITFDIDTSEADEDCDATGGVAPCDSHGGVSDDVGYVIDLGELTTTSVNDSGDTVTHADGFSGEINSIWFDLSSNADGGVAVIVQSLNGYLAGPSSAQIPSVSDGSEVQITAGSGLYGMNAFSGLVKSTTSGGVLIYDDCDGDTGDDYYCDVSTSPVEIFNTASAPIDSLRMEWEVGASPDNLDGTGTYTDELTFIATATF